MTLSWEEFEARNRAHHVERQRMRRAIAAALPHGAFVCTRKDGRETLVIRSGEMQQPGAGRWRVTFLDHDGPSGHRTRDTDAELVEVVHDDLWPAEVRPATEAEVIAWTSTPEYEEGARRIAEVQADNARRHRR